MSDQVQGANELPIAGDSKKEGKKYDINMKKLVAILGGENLLKPNLKVGQSEVAAAMEELVKEQRAAGKAEIIASVKSLVTKKIEFDRFAKSKQKELEKAIAEKQKEFNQESDKLFSKVDDLEEIITTYYEALVGASTPPAETSDNSIIPSISTED